MVSLSKLVEHREPYRFHDNVIFAKLWCGLEQMLEVARNFLIRNDALVDQKFYEAGNGKECGADYGPKDLNPLPAVVLHVERLRFVARWMPPYIVNGRARRRSIAPSVRMVASEAQAAGREVCRWCTGQSEIHLCGPTTPSSSAVIFPLMGRSVGQESDATLALATRVVAGPDKEPELERWGLREFTVRDNEYLNQAGTDLVLPLL